MATIPSIPTIQLFRNSIIKTGRQAAIDALEAQKASVADGGLILARYSEDGTDNGVKTLLGIVRNGGGTNVQLTVIDVEGAAENVQTAITNAINDLDSSATSENKYFDITVAQEDGKITSLTVTNKDIASASLLGTKEDASTAETAFGRIAKEAADREAAIQDLKLDKVGADGQVITAISQSNGIVSATAATLSADNVAFTSSDAAFKSSNVKDALDTLYTRSGDGSKVVIDSGTTTEGYSKTYTFTQGGIEIGKIDIPKDLVVKSGSVVKGNWNDGVFTENVSGSGTALKLVIANKEETPIYINTLDLVKDHTAGNGIAISDTNEISVKKASDSEPFLTVGADGVKLSGVTDAISEASGHVNTIIDARLGNGVTSDSTATAQFAELSNKLGTGITTAEGKTVTAQLQALSGSSTSDTSNTISVIGAKKYTDAKVEALDLPQVGGEGKVITTISQTDGQVSASAIALTANNVKATASTSSTDAVAVTGETVSAQIESLAKSIKSASTAAAAAHTKVTAKPSGHVTVEVSNDGSHDVVTIAEDDIASASALGTETNARVAQDNKIEAAVGLNADGNHVKTNGHYTSGASTIAGEITALDTKLKEVSDTLGTGVSTAAKETVTEQLQALSGRTGDASGVTSVEGAKAYAKDLVDNLKAEVGSTTGTSKTEAIKIVQAHGKIKSITLGAFDCGTYN